MDDDYRQLVHELREIQTVQQSIKELLARLEPRINDLVVRIDDFMLRNGNENKGKQ